MDRGERHPSCDRERETETAARETRNEQTRNVRQRPPPYTPQQPDTPAAATSQQVSRCLPSSGASLSNKDSREGLFSQYPQYPQYPPYPTVSLPLPPRSGCNPASRNAIVRINRTCRCSISSSR